MLFCPGPLVLALATHRAWCVSLFLSTSCPLVQPCSALKYKKIMLVGNPDEEMFKELSAAEVRTPPLVLRLSD